MNDALLRVDGLKKSYGDLEVLKGISFDLKKGETLSLIGPSGSGKSTCLRCLNFLERLDTGSVHLNAERIGQVPDKQGQLQGVMASIVSLASIFGPLYFAWFYFGIKDWWPGLIWIIGVATYLLAIPLILAMRNRLPAEVTA